MRFHHPPPHARNNAVVSVRKFPSPTTNKPTACTHMPQAISPLAVAERPSDSLQHTSTRRVDP
jgi:hypothetical protein